MDTAHIEPKDCLTYEISVTRSSMRQVSTSKSTLQQKHIDVECSFACGGGQTRKTSEFNSPVLESMAAAFRKLVSQLQPRQVEALRAAATPCRESCVFLHPIDDDKAAACVAECQDKHRELFVLENASGVLAGGAIALLLLVLAYTGWRLWSVSKSAHYL